MAETAVGFLPVPLRGVAEKAMQTLALKRDQWPDDPDSDDLSTMVWDAITGAVPSGKRLWTFLATNPELGTWLPGPGAVADTIEQVVIDAIGEQVDLVVWKWVAAALEAGGSNDQRGAD